MDRKVAMELIEWDAQMLEMIANGKAIDLYKYWRQTKKGLSLQDAAIEKMAQGLCCPIDLEEDFEVIGSLDERMNIEPLCFVDEKGA